jgi:HD superfamily phosphohydrolase
MGKNEHKIIRDPIHGDIKVEGLFVDLLETPELQRLYNIKQLGLAHLVFPGAHHTRLEHSLGTYNIASKAAENLGLKEDEKEILSCAALLHDIGHGPFSHTLESILRESLNVDHMDLAEKIIFGSYEIFEADEKEIIDFPSVCEILDRYSIDKKMVADIIKGDESKKPYLCHLLNGVVDVDQLDYLTRDAYYTGVAYGMIDTERFLQTLTKYDDNIAILRKGVGVVENILMARALMYSSVYFHKTVRIAELMLSKAIEMILDIDPFEFFRMTDDELITSAKKMGSYQFEIVTRLKYRKLFKQVYSKSVASLDEEHVEYVRKLEDVNRRREKERELEEQVGIPCGHVIIDVPYRELHLSEPRIDQTDIMVVTDEGAKKLDDFTPVASAIRSRPVPDWVVMIITDGKYRDMVLKKAEKILFN